ncbi:ribonuclease III [Spiroplasma syrphidicola EA-1]|uniref:Ribonuclease 3 n=1 Tax=Spiroplasma syrphidicola EA-1 TaxID=1276229 RepID=R4U730_9MOLU|nr:ribonuclease III [Spiroplasma syrphidicola]AGM26453.1 ribonuclease III [Spiroplasma syrphidicola EA-1]
MTFHLQDPTHLFNNLQKYFEQYQIKIKNEQFYFKALTHNSYANENNLNYTYQRLEFLGDAILQKEVSLYLFLKFPEMNEGEITSLRSKMVREVTLAELTRNINLGQFLLIGKGEIKTKGYEKDRILADIYESTIAALYLDLGEETVRHFIEQTLLKMVSDTDFLEQIRDYKTELQEFLQAGDSRVLEYKLVGEEILEGNRTIYTVVAEIDKVRYGQGQGYTHKTAEQFAAQDALQKLAKNNLISKN